jgi:hypothetical protein
MSTDTTSVVADSATRSFGRRSRIEAIEPELVERQADTESNATAPNRPGLSIIIFIFPLYRTTSRSATVRPTGRGQDEMT